MIYRKVDVRRCHTPPPISFLIRTAKSFDCDIFIQRDNGQVDVKNYEDLIRNMPLREQSVLFLFNGSDELAAKEKIERIFQY